MSSFPAAIPPERFRTRVGNPADVVSQKLGHSRPSFMADVYCHAYEDEHEEWVLDLSDLIEERRKE